MNKKIVGIVIIVTLIGIIGFYMANRNKIVQVDAAVAVEGSIEKYVEELGIVKAKNQGDIYASASGTVKEILVDIGDEVKKGDVLVKLDDMQVSKEIQGLEAERSAILAQYNEAKESVDIESIEKLELTVKDMERRTQKAEETANNSQRLYEAGAISHEEYKNTLDNLELEKSNLEKIKLDLELMNKPVSKNIIAQYEARLKQIDIQKEKLKDLSRDFTIISNIDGIVLRKTIEEGSYIQPGMDIMEIGNVEELYIESDILVDDIAYVQEGARVKISNKNLGLVDLEGVVKKIYPYAFTKVSDLGVEQRRVKVDIEIKDSIENIRPGYDLDIKIVVDSKANTILIPKDSIFDMEGKHFVFVNVDNKAELREVKKGLESQRQVEIISGLKKGETVILSPDEKIEEGINIDTKD